MGIFRNRWFPKKRKLVLGKSSLNHYTLTCSSGSTSITGTNANLLVSRVLSCNSASISITGTDAGLYRSFLLSCNSSSIIVTGVDASLIVSRVLTNQSGSILVTGTDASLITSRILTNQSGSISISGTDASLIASRILYLESSSIEITGQEAHLVKSGEWGLSSGSFTITPSDANLIVSRKLVCEGGSVDVTGTSANLIYNPSTPPSPTPPPSPKRSLSSMGKQGGGGIPIVSGKALRKALEDSTTTYIDIAIGDLFVKPKLPKSGEVKHYRLINKSLNIEVIGKPIKISVHRKLVSSPLPARVVLNTQKGSYRRTKITKITHKQINNSELLMGGLFSKETYNIDSRDLDLILSLKYYGEESRETSY